MKPINQIKTEKELDEWIQKKAKKIHLNLIHNFNILHEDLRGIEETYKEKLKEIYNKLNEEARE